MKKVLCVLVCMALAGVTVAADYYVDLNATGNNDGTSWADAWTTLDSAMTGAASSSTINIAEGTYTSSSVWTPTNNILTIKAKTGDNVILSGDVNGDDTFADLLDDPCALNVACTSGDHSDNRAIFDFDNKTITLQDLTVSGSNGMAISMSGSSNITVNNCLFTQNYTANNGACFDAGTSNDAGGALTLTNSRFIQNSSWKTGSVFHHKQQGTITINGCLFKINCAIDYAAAVNIDKYCKNLNITDSIFDRCFMCNNTGGNGGIFQRMANSNSQTTITNCVFTECLNAYGGGGPAAAYYFQGYADGAAISNLAITINNCLFYKNKATGDDSTLHFEDKLAGFDLTVDINNCTIAENRNTKDGRQGAVGYFVNFDNTGGTTIDINLKNTILWGNTGGTDGANKAQLYTDTTKNYTFGTVSADYCCWDNTDPNDLGYTASLGTGNLLKKADASLDPGFEVTLPSACVLASGSPCIDTGDPTSDYSAEPKCNGGRINMGAYGGTIYATPTATSSKLADLDCDNDVDLADFSAMSGEWLQ